MPTDDAEVSRAETMLKALGVKTEERLNTLVRYFFSEKRDEAKFLGDANDEARDFEVSPSRTGHLRSIHRGFAPHLLRYFLY
jgi:hypothetical protein